MPKAKTIIAISRNMPNIWATIINFSLGLRPVTISTIRNSRWPPSNPGIGIRFITPNIIDSIASKLMNISQFQCDGNTCPIAMKLPTDLYAPVLGVATSFKSRT